MAIDVKCERCDDPCYGDVVKVAGNYFHQNCFTCKVTGCNGNLIQDGYFVIDGDFYCRDDYHETQGTRCARCNFYVEGVAISAVDAVFHPTCFACFHCNNIFNPNIEVCYDGERIACESCTTTSSSEPTEDLTEIEPPSDLINTTDNFLPDIIDDIDVTDPEIVSINYSHTSIINYNHTIKCASCGDYIGECKSLMALDKPWHLRCFTCHKCGKLLAEEYIGKDGIPYCEQDYQLEFGVLCSGCNDYITGKVLQAGGKHYHPQCSRCGKCDELFGEGEEMYLRGSEIWHPRCSEENELIEVMSDANISDADVTNTSINMRDTNTPEILEETISVSAAKRFFERQQQIEEPVANSTTLTNGLNGDASAEHTVNVWKPPYQTSQSISLSQPAGFLPVKPPPPSTVDETLSEEEDAPPVPPPPKRSSSSSWRLKYSSSGVYAPAPFQKPPTIKNFGPITDTGTYLNSADSTEIEKNDTVFIDTQNQNLFVDSESELNGASPSLVRKGLGYNKLQYRRSLRESQRQTGNK